MPEARAAGDAPADDAVAAPAVANGAGVDRAPTRAKPPARLLRKRWRGWLRAVHRDVGYFAVGFTVLYALSGIAMNHIDDWDPNFHASEQTLKIAPIPEDISDFEAARRLTAATRLTGKIDDVYRAGDEVRLTFASGSKVTAIGDTVTVQLRRDRLFFRIADWLHATRGKQAWKFIADIYAVLLLYLAISGIFMIKGRLGLQWRGATLIVAGLAAPIGYIVLSGGPGAQKTEKLAARPGEADPAPARLATPATLPAPAKLPMPAAPPTPAARDDGITPLPPDDN